MIFLDKKGRGTMTALTENMFAIFDQSEFSFKKIKENQSPEEVAELKEKFKAVWQVWKKVNQTVASQLPPDQFAKVHVESWTNGWNLRDHYWASYRLASLADYNPCIGVMLDKNQLQVYLMFQHYKSEQRQGTVDEYNQLLDRVPEWADNIDATHWYLWDKDEMEFSDHLPLSKYLNNHDIQQQFNTEARQTSFLLGKFAFRGKDQVNDMEEYISSVIRQLIPLYEELK